MKTNAKTARLGTVLLSCGIALLVLTLVGFLTYSSYTPADFTQTDETVQNRIDSLTTSSEMARRLVAPRIDNAITYYSARAGEANPAYAERASFFESLKQELAAGRVSRESFDKVSAYQRSVDGIEEEVQTLNGVINQLRVVYDSENEAEALQATLGTNHDSLGGRIGRALSALSGPAWLLIALAGVLLIVAGLYLNHSWRTRKVMGQVMLYLLLTIGAVIMVFPFYWMIISSLKTRVEVSRFPPEFAPGSWTNIENYRIAFHQAPFAKYFLNSLIVCFFSVLIVTFTTILGAFAFSRLKFPGRELIFSALLSMMMLPFEMLVITNYSTVIQLGLNDTLGALVLPFISSIFYTYIMRNFFASIPDSLYWSARVDGCSNWRYLWKVMVPIGRPSLVTVVLLNALASWNSFMWPLLVIKSTANRTLPFGLYTFTTEAGAFQELIMAASTVVVLPMIILFLFARKQILRGVARGGLKG